MSDTEGFDAFLSKLWSDHEAGEIRPLSEYLAQFEVGQERIAREYLAIRDVGDQDDGDRIAHYRMLKQLGRGGQATVYLAQDERLNRKVALKVLRGRAFADSRAARRLAKEAEIVGNLDHRGICTVHEAGTYLGTPYIVMQFIDGQTLANALAAQREGLSWFTPIDEETDADTAEDTLADRTSARQPTSGTVPTDIRRVVSLVEEIANILDYAHENGIVHRDLKPGNVMLTGAGDPVVLDFGLATQPSDDGREPLTSQGQYVGTPAYMAPEQFELHGEAQDRRVDVWALGVLLFECLTLTRPFVGPTKADVRAAIRNLPPANVRKLNPRVSRDLQIVVETALEKDTDRRYQHARDLGEDLRRILSYEPILARPVGPWIRMRRWVQRNVAFVGSTAAIVAGLLIGLLVALSALEDARAEQERRQTQQDLERIAELHDWADHLWPLSPEMVHGRAGALSWLATADDVLGRLPEHESALAVDVRALGPEDQPSEAEIRKVMRRSNPQQAELLERLRGVLEELAKEQPASPELAALKARVDELERPFARGAPWLHKDHDAAWHLRNRDAVRESLDTLPALVERVRERVRFVEAIQERMERAREDWDRVIDDVRASDRYGFSMRPVFGLVPLGPDPESNLEEFAVLGSGNVPRRGADSKLVLSVDSAIIVVLVPGGSFEMGTPDGMVREANERRHRVSLDPFFIGKYEVTRSQWRSVMGDPGSAMRLVLDGHVALPDDAPVEGQTWPACRNFVRAFGLRLPTEAQWEYAYRAGAAGLWPYGEDVGSIEDRGNVRDEAFARAAGRSDDIAPWDDGHAWTTSVGAYRANAFGLHDMEGNVREWCRDRYDADYPEDSDVPGDGWALLAVGAGRVVRGGCWIFPPAVCRCAYRQWTAPDTADSRTGLRVAAPVQRDE